MITFGDICGLAFLIAVPLIGIKLYNDHQNDVIGWANNDQRDKEIDDFKQFLISHESANEISEREIDWYIGEYCETKSKSFEEFQEQTRINILGNLSNHKRLLDKYKNTENFNEVEFFQELNERLNEKKRKEDEFTLSENIRTKNAIDTGIYISECKKYFFDFNGISSFARKISEYGQYVIVFKNLNEPLVTNNEEAFALFIKFQEKQLNK